MSNILFGCQFFVKPQAVKMSLIWKKVSVSFLRYEWKQKSDRLLEYETGETKIFTYHMNYMI